MNTILHPNWQSVVLVIGVVGVAIAIMKVMAMYWHGIPNSKPGAWNMSVVFHPFARPLMGYVVLMGVFLLGKSLYYLTTGEWIRLNWIYFFAVGMVGVQYVFMMTKSVWITAVSGIGMMGLWMIHAYGFLSRFLIGMNQYAVSIGSWQMTPWRFLKSIVMVLIFLWATSMVSQLFKNRMKQLKTLKIGTREILIKSFDILIYVILGLLVLHLLGLDLSTLTVIGGALGVGIGFGLQKITSNFISGLILLFEKSIEIDDLVELEGGIYGFIRRLGSRYTLIETFDGKEVLIPNEDFITNRVTNWTFSNRNGRIDIDVGVSYQSDIELAQSLILAAATEHPRCVFNPPPECHLREFGSSSVNFKLLFFVSDVELGRWSVQSEVMIAIWKKFKDHHIEIPFPQCDIHIKSPNGSLRDHTDQGGLV
jgi:small-conductance mechanosensitive channel